MRHTDQLDQASEYEQMVTDAAIKRASIAASRPEIPFVGQCYNCESVLSDGHRFCDADCRHDYERRKANDG